MIAKINMNTQDMLNLKILLNKVLNSENRIYQDYKKNIENKILQIPNFINNNDDKNLEVLLREHSNLVEGYGSDLVEGYSSHSLDDFNCLYCLQEDDCTVKSSEEDFKNLEDHCNTIIMDAAFINE